MSSITLPIPSKPAEQGERAPQRKVALTPAEYYRERTRRFLVLAPRMVALCERGALVHDERSDPLGTEARAILAELEG